MKTVDISLNSIDKVKSFVNDISKFDFDFDLVSGRYVIDAKSIMGIFSLDLSKPITLNVHAEDSSMEPIMAILEKYLVYYFVFKKSSQANSFILPELSPLSGLLLPSIHQFFQLIFPQIYESR